MSEARDTATLNSWKCFQQCLNCLKELMFTLKNTCSYIQQAKKRDRSRQRVAWGVRGIFDLDQLLTFTRTCVLEAFSQRFGMLISTTKYAAIRNSTMLEKVLRKFQTVHRTLLHSIFLSYLMLSKLISEMFSHLRELRRNLCVV